MDGALNYSGEIWRPVSKGCGFGQRIYRFRVDGRRNRVTNIRFQKYPNSCGGLNHCVYEDAGITLYIFRKVSRVFIMTDFLTKIIAKAVKVRSATYINT